MYVAFTDLLVSSPRAHDAGGIDRIGAQGGWVGEGDDEVGVRSEHSVNLAEDPVKVIDEGQGPHRYGDVDLISADKGEFGGTGFMKLDRHR